MDHSCRGRCGGHWDCGPANTERRPTITIVFKAAEGVEAGKTFVKYKDVNIGQVKTVKLSSDYTKVVVTAKIDKSAEGLIVEDAEFWSSSRASP